MNWYVVQTKPNREMQALSHLERQGFSVWMPKCSRLIKHARQTKKVLRPLFPGYVFVQFDPTFTQWRAINNTVGVICLVSFGSAPSILDVDFVNSLKTYENEQGIIEASVEGLKVGASVEILDGPMTGIVGKLVRIDTTDRVTILLELLGNLVHSKVAKQNIVPV